MAKGFTVIVTSAVVAVRRIDDLADAVGQRLRPGGRAERDEDRTGGGVERDPRGASTTRWTASRAPVVAGVPPSVSFASTLASTVRPGNVTPPLSFTASMTYGARTVTVTVASSQFEASAISQIRYTSVWTPTAAPAATVDRAGGGVERDAVGRGRLSGQRHVRGSSRRSRRSDRWRGRSRPPCRRPSSSSHCRRRHRSRRAPVRPCRRGPRRDGRARPSPEARSVTAFVFTSATATLLSRGTAM